MYRYGIFDCKHTTNALAPISIDNGGDVNTSSPPRSLRYSTLPKKNKNKKVEPKAAGVWTMKEYIYNRHVALASVVYKSGNLIP